MGTIRLIVGMAFIIASVYYLVYNIYGAFIEKGVSGEA